MFDELLESSAKRAARGGRPLLASLLVHSAVLLILATLPLVFYQNLPEAQFLTFLGAAPPEVPSPPTPPPAPVVDAKPLQVARAATRHPVFQLPTEIPEGIPAPPEQLPGLASDAGYGLGAGVPGGPTGVDGLALVGAGVPVPEAVVLPPPPPPVRRNPVRVGGDLQSAKLIRRVDPVYPPLAIKARVQGTVLLHATIGETGEIVDIQVLQGHPMLREAAVQAVRQWIYSPTLLNGEPVEVITEISVNFRLGR